MTVTTRTTMHCLKLKHSLFWRNMRDTLLVPSHENCFGSLGREARGLFVGSASRHAIHNGPDVGGYNERDAVPLLARHADEAVNCRHRSTVRPTRHHIPKFTTNDPGIGGTLTHLFAEVRTCRPTTSSCQRSVHIP
jgi:hypothetical protein